MIWKTPSFSLQRGALNICSPACVVCDTQNTIKSSSHVTHPSVSGIGSLNGGMRIVFFSPTGGRYENFARYFRKKSTLTTPQMSIRRNPAHRMHSDSMSMSAIMAQLKVRNEVNDLDFVSYRDRSTEDDIPFEIVKAESIGEWFVYAPV